MQVHVQQNTRTFHSHRGTTRQPTERRQATETSPPTRTKTSIVKKRINRAYTAAQGAIAGHIMRPHPAIVAAMVLKAVTENSPELYETQYIRNLIGATERLVRMDGGKLKAYSAWRTQWNRFCEEPMIKTAMTTKVVEAITEHLVGSDKLVLLDKSAAELQELLQTGNILDFADCFCGTTSRSNREKEIVAKRQDFLGEPSDQIAFAK